MFSGLRWKPTLTNWGIYLGVVLGQFGVQKGTQTLPEHIQTHDRKLGQTKSEILDDVWLQFGTMLFSFWTRLAPKSPQGLPKGPQDLQKTMFVNFGVPKVDF